MSTAGNPFRIGPGASREQAIARYRADLWRRIRAGEIALADLAALASRRLACHPKPCHGLVLARAAAWAALSAQGPRGGVKRAGRERREEWRESRRAAITQPGARAMSHVTFNVFVERLWRSVKYEDV